jgi:hypothetical protein
MAVRAVTGGGVDPALARRLLYRGQFMLGPQFVEELEGWQRHRLGPGLLLTAHPDLEVTVARSESRWLALVGYVLDPFNAAATNADLVASLLHDVAAGKDLFRAAARLGGRWILIDADASRTRLFHDAVGVRQVYYTEIGRVGALWCASQPGLLGETLHLPPNVEANAIISSIEWPDGEHRLPGTTSPFLGVRRLQPNHYLDLSTGTSHRYWPMERLARVRFEDCVESSSAMLRGLMESAVRRFPLGISITAGRDSRLVLAAARRIALGASYVTVAKPTQPAWDVEVPAKLLPQLGLTHDIIPWPSHVDEEFARVFRRNITPHQEVWVPEAYAVFSYNRLTKVGVTGSAGEHVRQRRRTSLFGEDDDNAITPERLVSQARMSGSALALEELTAWLSEAPKLGNPSVLDLFRWEGRNWLATAQLTFDIAWKDVLTPFNCRLLLENMLGVERNLRCGPRFLLFTAMTRYLWPEVLQQPFPEKEKRSPLLTPARVKRALRLSVGLVRKRIASRGRSR